MKYEHHFFLFGTVVTVELENRTYTVPENEGHVEVCAVIVRGSLERTVIITLSTKDGSAIGLLKFLLQNMLNIEMLLNHPRGYVTVKSRDHTYSTNL